jgi:hypothetical protein
MAAREQSKNSRVKIHYGLSTSDARVQENKSQNHHLRSFYDSKKFREEEKGRIKITKAKKQ